MKISTVIKTVRSLDNSFTVTATGARFCKFQHRNRITVLEPNIPEVQKTASPTLGDADDTINFNVQFSNNGTASAFDVRLTDDLAAGELDNLNVAGIEVRRNNVVVPETEYVNNSTATNFDISINEVAANDNIAVIYNADIINSIEPNYQFDNTTNLTYSTLPGEGTQGNDTGSTTPGTSGVETGERNGDDGIDGINNYVGSDTTTLNTPGLAATKSIVATSEASTPETDNGIANPKDLTIGEVVRYRLLVEIPEGQINDIQVADILPAGLRYLDDGSAKAALVANDTGEIFSNDTDTIDLAAISGDQSNIGSVDPATDVTPTINGTSLLFNLGNIRNNDDEDYDPDNNNKEYAVVEYNAVVENIVANQDGTIDDPATARSSFTSNFTVGASNDNADDVASNNVSAEVLEPEIVNVEQTATPTIGDAEDSITYEVIFSNTGTATAFDVNVTDDLATDDLDNLNNLVVQRTDADGNNATTLNLGEDYDTLPGHNNTNLNISIDEVAAGDRIVVSYDADIVNDIAPVETLNSTADVTYSTLPGEGTETNPTGSTTPGTSGANDGERNGSGNTANNYADDANTEITTPNLVATQFLVGTSEPSTENANVTIGEVVRYRLLVELPEGRIDNLKVNNNLPAGLKYLKDGSATVALVSNDPSQIRFVDTNNNPPAIARPNSDPNVRKQGDENNIDEITPNKSINAQNAAGNTFDPATDTDPVFNLGNVLNNDDETFAQNSNKEYAIIEFNALVENVLDNQDGVNLTNTYTVTYGNDGISELPNSIAVEIIEPSIGDITKTASTENANAGEAVTFTVTYTNDSNTTAFDVRLLDRPPSTELENIRSVEFDSSGSLDTVNNNSTANKVDATIASVAPGETITITYQADLVEDLTPGSTVTNSATVTYTSLPNEGTPDTSFINPTGSDAPGASGAADGERNGSDVNGTNDAAELNNYGGIVSETVDINSLSLGSTVFEDANNNGIQEEGEAGIANVVLDLYDENGNRVRDRNNNPITTTTDSNGNYIFEGLPSGSYQIVIPASNFNSGQALANNTIVSNDVDQNDNQEDGDNNGSQTGAATKVTSPVIVLSVGDEPTNDTTETVAPGNQQDDINADNENTDADGDMTVDFGFVPVGQIRGNVAADVNSDRLGETDLPGVTLTLFDSDGIEVATTQTNRDGNYIFANVLSGDYTVRQTQPEGYGSVVERDSINNGANDDDTDADNNDNVLPVSISDREIDTGNDFVEVELGTIRGNVTTDTDNNDIGDRDLEGVEIELLNSSGDPIDSDPDEELQPTTTATDENGNYEFTNLFPGDYRVRETNLPNYGDVYEFDSDASDRLDEEAEAANEANDNVLSVSLAAGETDIGNDFVDEEFATVTGNVSADINNDNTGDEGLENVTLELLDGENVVDTAQTDGTGNYQFTEISPGDYQIRQVNLDNYGDVSEFDSDTSSNLDEDAETANASNDNLLDVSLVAGETDIGNDFVDEEFATVTGNVSEDLDNNESGDRGLEGVTLQLLDSNNNVVDTTETNNEGNYQFTEIFPGNYRIRQINLDGYGDVSDSDGEDPNVTNVSLNPGETSSGNNFVDERGRITGRVFSR